MEGFGFNHSKYKEIFVEAIKLLDLKEESLLDAGCGIGLLIDHLDFKNITGLDIDEKALEIARNKNKYKRLNVIWHNGKNLKRIK